MCRIYGKNAGKKDGLISGNSLTNLRFSDAETLICAKIVIPMKTMIIVAALALSFNSVQAHDGLVSKQPFAIEKATAAAPQGFGYFRIHRQAADVALNWAIEDPSSVVCFSVERSFDGVMFFEIDEVGCTAGNPTYKYRDTGAFPGSLYYRIVARMSDGTTVNSPVEMIRIVSKRG